MRAFGRTARVTNRELQFLIWWTHRHERESKREKERIRWRERNEKGRAYQTGAALHNRTVTTVRVARVCRCGNFSVCVPRPPCAFFRVTWKWKNIPMQKSKPKNVHANTLGRENHPRRMRPAVYSLLEPARRKAPRGPRPGCGTTERNDETSVREDFRNGTNKFYFATSSTKTSKLAGNPGFHGVSQFLQTNVPLFSKYLPARTDAIVGRSDFSRRINFDQLFNTRRKSAREIALARLSLEHPRDAFLWRSKMVHLFR